MFHQDSGRGRPADAGASEDLRPLAREVLSYCEDATKAAAEALATHYGPQTTALTNLNTFTDNAPRNLSEISEEARRNLKAVLERPAVARLLTLNDAGVQEIIYITPSGAPRAFIGGARVASYRSEVGKLAAQPIGAEISLPNLRSVELLAKTTFKPERTGRGWDAYNSIVESGGRTPRTILWLRALLDAAPEEDALLLLEAALRGDSPLVFDGIRRTVVERMSLRDQPLLDQYQDAIFRRPLDTQILILGPPGSGKTTTLIKRLGMKVDQDALTEDELRQIGASVSGGTNHATSWLMFSPSELLRQYVKEAFAREQVPASDRQMMVWDRYRDRIAKETLGILRSGSSAGANVRSALANLKPDTINNQTAWYDDFVVWQETRFWSELNDVATALADDPGTVQPRLIKDLVDLVQRSAATPSLSVFGAFKTLERPVREAASTILEGINDELRRAFAEQMRKQGTLLDDLLAFIQTLDDDHDDPEEVELEGDEDDDDAREGRHGREMAFDAFIRAVRAHARATATSRRLSTRGRNARIIEWMGDRLPDRDALVDLGKRARRVSALRRLANPARAYVRRLPIRYRRFRRERASEQIWYADVPYAPTDLSPLEVDLAVLAVLRTSRRLLAQSDPSMGAGAGLFDGVKSLFRTQILVDEATDFSALQLACMAALADPATNSFTACGDFNQRITEWGVRASDEITWISPSIKIERIHVTYRHSRQLNQLAHRIAQLSGEHHEQAALPEHVENEGMDPVLGVGLKGKPLAAWIAARTREINRIAGNLPSLAVLVNTEEEVAPLAADLGEALAEWNIRCTACFNGQATGDDGDVRVFDIQHIKGLEFEGVFFIGVDRLAAAHPTLFNKYLYVGATRAACISE